MRTKDEILFDIRHVVNSSWIPYYYYYEFTDIYCQLQNRERSLMLEFKLHVDDE